MKKVSVFIDGYNLYHAIDSLDKPYLKWVNPKLLCKYFIQSKEEEIQSVKFFTAFPKHKSNEIQARYKTYTDALRHYGFEVIEGNFKRKLLSYFNSNGERFTRASHEEKESDVNLAIAILEDAYENKSNKILVITNDSDIAPAIKMAKEKNVNLKINIVTPPLIKTKQVSYDLYNASGNRNINRKGQTFVKLAIIREFMLEQARMPDEIISSTGEKIVMPVEYRKV